MRPKAEIITCSKGNETEHAYRDNCYTCAPWWDKYPICPTHKRKLTQAGYCKECRHFYDITEVKR